MNTDFEDRYMLPAGPTPKACNERRDCSDVEVGGKLRINLDAIVRNYDTIRSLAAPATCAAVLKADAYGLGAADIAPALYAAGCRDFFVAHLSEARDLRRQVEPSARIMVLNGVVPSAMPAAMADAITPVLNTLEQAITWARLVRSQSSQAFVVLQVDTGMTRLGLSAEDAQAFSGILSRDGLGQVDVLMSHMASADVPDNAYCDGQRQSLLRLARLFPGARLSLANSAGCFMGTDYTLDFCRPGAALFGIRVSSRSPKLIPAVDLDLRIAQIRKVPAGVTVGYGRTYTTHRASRIATISAGYADGIPRNLTAPAGVWLEGKKMSIVGRVCMDSFMVDATEIISAELREGGWVEFLGPNQSAEDVGSVSGTIGYEILTRLGSRYARTILPAC